MSFRNVSTISCRDLVNGHLGVSSSRRPSSSANVGPTGAQRFASNKLSGLGQLPLANKPISVVIEDVAGHLYALRGKRRAVRLQLHALAYNLANFLRTAATSEPIERWSLTSLRERLIKTGTRLVRHARYAVFQMAEAGLPRSVFAGILGLINGLRGSPAIDLAACRT